MTTGKLGGFLLPNTRLLSPSVFWSSAYQHGNENGVRRNVGWRYALSNFRKLSHCPVLCGIAWYCIIQFNFSRSWVALILYYSNYRSDPGWFAILGVGCNITCHSCLKILDTNSTSWSPRFSLFSIIRSWIFSLLSAIVFWIKKISQPLMLKVFCLSWSPPPTRVSWSLCPLQAPPRTGAHDSVVESAISQQKAQAHCLQQRGVAGWAGQEGNRDGGRKESWWWWGWGRKE